MTLVKSELLKRLLKRRSFSGLMDLYEINYGLVNRLAPCLASIEGTVISRVPNSPDLYLAVVERCRFTTMLRLTYYFTDAAGAPVADPDLQIRLYHDAGQAEAMTCQGRGAVSFPNPELVLQGVLECKWDSNIFLEKWLRYALSLGHTFDARSEVAELGPAHLEPSLSAS